MTQTLRRERIQKFDNVLISILSEHWTDLKDELRKSVLESLADASISRSEKESNGSYWDNIIKHDVAKVVDETTNTLMRGDWREYPEHLHEVAKCLRDTWMFVLPERPKKGSKKSQYSFFIMAMESIKQSCGEFGIKPLIETHKKWDAYRQSHNGIAPYTIATPQSLVNVVAGTAREMREVGTSEVKIPSSRNLND